MADETFQAAADAIGCDASEILSVAMHDGVMYAVTTSARKYRVEDGVATETESAPAADVANALVAERAAAEPVGKPTVLEGTSSLDEETLGTLVEPETGEPIDVPDGGDASTAEPENVDYDHLSVEELKGILRDRELAVSGRKAELVKRLNDDDAGA